MMKVVENNVLVVPPFDCAWLSGEDVQFAEPGRGCVAFEARAENDVTVIFKELAGCKHYRTDSDPNYTVIIGSNLNRRLKIEANGRTVVDVAAGALLLSRPSAFERFWISVEKGVITVGKGDPGQNAGYRWVDPEPNCKIEFVGLSSWDKHVGYRNVTVLPPVMHFLFPTAASASSASDAQWSSGLANYCENEALSDFQFVISSPHNRRVPAHRALLLAVSSAKLESSPFMNEELVLQSVDYSVLHAALLFIYTGNTQLEGERLSQLQELAELLAVEQLASHCKKLIQQAAGAGSNVVRLETASPGLLVNTSVLTNMLSTGYLSDLELLFEDYGTSLHLHRLVLSVWSAPFAKMFTSGMRESSRMQVTIKDVQLDAFVVMIRFMYTGRLELDEKDDTGCLLLPLLILADRYGVHLLQQECEKLLRVCVNEDCSTAILQVASSMQACESLRQSCEECCAKHFDYCVTASEAEFKELDARTVMRILQHPDLLVTSEEKLLDAVVMWGANTEEIHGWEDVEKRFKSDSEIATMMHQREEDFKSILPSVRFPLMPLGLLQQLDKTLLCDHMPFLHELVFEAMQYLIQEAVFSDDQKDTSRISNHGRLIRLPKNPLWFTRRLSSFKELLYLSDGDSNGVLYYAGTSYGAHAWMNPALTKEITMTSSSPQSRYTDPKVLVSRNYQATSFTGPCIENGMTMAWWKVDLGASHELMCNYYSVRQDGSANFARTWAFQGSADGEVWTDLRKHEKDFTICKPAQYASWPVHGAKSLIPFRFFRFLLKQPIEGVACPWNLSICYLELYGYLH